MAIEERRIRIRGLLNEIEAAREFVVESATRAGLDDTMIHHCQLAVDEVCTNVVEHGYGSDDVTHIIDIICRLDADRFTIIIIDDGPPFDPLQRSDPDPKTSLEHRQTGGWGIYFIKRLMDEVSYDYHESRNWLAMTKYLKHPS